MKKLLLPTCTALTLALAACTSESKGTPPASNTSNTPAEVPNAKLASYKLNIEGMT